jgi:hypothetical protein
VLLALGPASFILKPAVAAWRSQARPSVGIGYVKSCYHPEGDLRSKWKSLAANAALERKAAELPDLGSWQHRVIEVENNGV